MRPTKGEISCTFASAQATAWGRENSNVRLQRTPSACKARAAWMPSQVDAILISTRSRGTPAASYSAISPRARSMVARVSNDRRASTSVDTRPGTMFRMARPKATSRRSTSSGVEAPPWSRAVFSSSGR
ncbi:hypothetical protein G6F24_018294 [Rhizopus arrhizus]|nr:hypothetical protein G6F24_018294 [Rhizopus arrhizus]